jgi:hypothetical protein
MNEHSRLLMLSAKWNHIFWISEGKAKQYAEHKLTLISELLADLRMDRRGK